MTSTIHPYHAPCSRLTQRPAPDQTDGAALCVVFCRCMPYDHAPERWQSNLHDNPRFPKDEGAYYGACP
jgi:hypothetical protein